MNILLGYSFLTPSLLRKGEFNVAAVPATAVQRVTVREDVSVRVRIASSQIIPKAARKTGIATILCHTSADKGPARFLIVPDVSTSETADFANVALPAASAFEESSTFNNRARDVQRVSTPVEKKAAQPEMIAAK